VSLKKSTILVVDDDAKVRDSIRGVLTDEGFRVRTARDGQEALASIRRERPGLVLLDVWMPEMDGIEVLARIKETAAELPVVVLSGHGNVEMAVKATKLGAIDFIEKPFSIEGLLSSLRRALQPPDAEGQGETAPAEAEPLVAEAGAPKRKQRTVAKSVVGGGHGLHSGVRTGLILHPLPPGSGIRFGKVGSEDYIEAVVDNVESTGYATTLYKHGLVARTVEHLMAALHAYGITNLLVKVDSEVPILDGSAAQFCKLLDNAGLEDQAGTVPVYRVHEEVSVEPDADSFIRVLPGRGLKITYELSYPDPIGEQTYTFELSQERFRREIAPARTFGFVEEIRALESAGLGQGGQLGNFILIGESGIVNTKLRFPEELARHKILDLLGDLYLLGQPLVGVVHARKTGHRHNIALVQKLRGRSAAQHG
jgi:UDP-3-O-[3-hydroxymyristoyl] N-acetylglucosamine deacetylase